MAVLDPDKNLTVTEYDALNRRTKVTDPLTKVSTFAYDAAGNLTDSTDRLGRRRSFAYDERNRLTNEVWKAVGGATVDQRTYTYDAADNPTYAANNAGAYTSTFDALNRVKSVQEPFGIALTYSYDAAGRQTLVQDNKGTTQTSVYDAANNLTTRLWSATGPGAAAASVYLVYDNRNQLVGVYYANNATNTQWSIQELLSRDAFNNVTGVTWAMLTYPGPSASSVETLTYTYDLAGRLLVENRTSWRTPRTDPPGGPTNPVYTYTTPTLTYDQDNELQSDGQGNYSYDDNGNRTDGSTTIGPGNQLKEDATATYAYDAEGNLTGKTLKADNSKWTYTYDHNNQMASALQVNSAGTTLAYETFQYDVSGNRLEQNVQVSNSPAVPVGVTHFAYNGANVWADLDGGNGNAVKVRYVQGDMADQHFARADATNGVMWYATDRQKSVINLLFPDGSAEGRKRYIGFVSVFDVTGTVGDRYQYTGREYDPALKLQYSRARWYDPTTGRWTSQDPDGFRAGDGRQLYFPPDDN